MKIELTCERCGSPELEAWQTLVQSGAASQETRCTKCRYKVNVVLSAGVITTHPIFPQDPE